MLITAEQVLIMRNAASYEDAWVSSYVLQLGFATVTEKVTTKIEARIELLVGGRVAGGGEEGRGCAGLAGGEEEGRDELLVPGGWWAWPLKADVPSMTRFRQTVSD